VADIINVTNWDNDATTYGRCYAGYIASDLDCIYYLDNVVLAGERSVCLQVTVDGGGDDYIEQTISVYSELWCSFDVYISDADTSGFIVGKRLALAVVTNAGGTSAKARCDIRLNSVSGKIEWYLSIFTDAGVGSATTSDVEVVTNTWYNLIWHVKEATAAGADNGISDLKVNGVEVHSITNWDNDTSVWNTLWLGGDHTSLFDAICYIEDVKLRALVTTYVDDFPTGFAQRDTIFIIEETFGDGVLDGWSTSGTVAIADAWDRTYVDENFDTGSLAGWTPEGGVDLIKNPDGIATDSVLRVTVSGGGSDHIQRTITDRDEHWLSCSLYISDVDTSGWDEGEYISVAWVGPTAGNNGAGRVAVYRVGEALKWRIAYWDDDEGYSIGQSAATLSTNTWYSLIWHTKKATAAGADDGISNLKVDGTEVIAITDWDNEEALLVILRVPLVSSTLDAIYYLDNVKLQGELNRRLEVTVVGAGNNYIEKTIPSCDEYWFECNFYLTDADTSGWDINDGVSMLWLANSGSGNGESFIYLVRIAGILTWAINTKDDGGTARYTYATKEVLTNTWYALLWHIKKASAAGASDGVSDLKVNGVEVVSYSTWDNDATVYNVHRTGKYATDINTIYYVDPVKLWSREGLP